MPFSYQAKTASTFSMRLAAALLAATALLLSAGPAEAQSRGRGHDRHGHHRDQDAAFHAMRQGEILPLHAILARVRVPGAQYIGAELDPRGTVYRLKFMRGGEVIWLDVDARSGRVLGRVR